MSWQPNLAKHDPSAARAYVGDSLRGPDFALAWNRLSGNVKAARARLDSDATVAQVVEAVRQDSNLGAIRYAVAVLEEDQLPIYQVESRIVEVTGEALARHLARRDNRLELERWPAVQRVIEAADLVVRQASQTTAIGATANGLVRVSVRSQESPPGTVLVDARPTTQAAARRLAQSGEVIRDEL